MLIMEVNEEKSLEWSQPSKAALQTYFQLLLLLFFSSFFYLPHPSVILLHLLFTGYSSAYSQRWPCLPGLPKLLSKSHFLKLNYRPLDILDHFILCQGESCGMLRDTSYWMRCHFPFCRSCNSVSLWQSTISRPCYVSPGREAACVCPTPGSRHSVSMMAAFRLVIWMIVGVSL